MLSSGCANWSPLYYQWPGRATARKRGQYVLSGPPSSNPQISPSNYKVAFKKMCSIRVRVLKFFTSKHKKLLKLLNCLIKIQVLTTCPMHQSMNRMLSKCLFSLKTEHIHKHTLQPNRKIIYLFICI